MGGDSRIRRRAAIVGAIALGVAVPALGGKGVAQAGPDPRPNVIVVMSDDQDAASMRFMPEVKRRIGDRGVTFRNSFTNWPLCCPSRATYLTGQYAINHGVRGNGPPGGGYERFRQLHGNDNLATWMQDDNYYTGHVGKFMNGYPLEAEPDEVPNGWDEWYANSGNTQAVYNYAQNQNGTIVNYGAEVADFKGDVITERAVDFIERRSDAQRPFFLSVGYTAPHIGFPDPSPQPPFDCALAAKPAVRHAKELNSEPLPLPPSFDEPDVSDKPAYIQARGRIDPEETADLERRYRCRMESLLHVDEGVSDMISALRAADELTNTLVIYTSDNGWVMGEHRLRPSKNNAYEEALRVPLLMRGPGLPANAKIRDLVVNPDTTATILDVANAPAGNVLDGRSLLPVASDPGMFKGRGLLIEKGATSGEGEPEDPAAFVGIRTARFKYVEHGTGELELYDLKRDPYELESLHDDPAYDVKEANLAARLEALKTCSGETCH